MTTTIPPFGWPVPLDSDPLADGAAAIRNLAGAISTDLAGDKPWVFALNTTWTFDSNGSVDVSFNNTTPHGWEWASVAVTCFQRNNTFPTVPALMVVGNVTTTGCTVHRARVDSGDAMPGGGSVTFSIVGLIRMTTP